MVGLGLLQGKDQPFEERLEQLIAIAKFAKEGGGTFAIRGQARMDGTPEEAYLTPTTNFVARTEVYACLERFVQEEHVSNVREALEQRFPSQSFTDVFPEHGIYAVLFNEYQGSLKLD